MPDASTPASPLSRFGPPALLAGFVLVRRVSGAGESPSYSMAEFFVMRKYRRKGVGTEVARRIFDMFPGRWEVAQNSHHTESHAFWQRVIGEYTDGQYEQTVDEDGDLAQVFDNSTMGE